mgnify:CR=1 FL=1|jgi:hypothetical protein
MKDETLERIWKQRQTISERCGYDSRKLVCYYQKRNQAKSDKSKASTTHISSMK